MRSIETSLRPCRRAFEARRAVIEYFWIKGRIGRIPGFAADLGRSPRPGDWPCACNRLREGRASRIAVFAVVGHECRKGGVSC
jgi:hypothetical protein